MKRCVKLELPYPPSLNAYYRNVRGKTLLSRRGRDYIARVRGVVLECDVDQLDGRLAIFIDMYPPDRRKRDLDNINKPIWDALEKAGVYDNDSQIVQCHAYKQAPIDGGMVAITLIEVSEVMPTASEFAMDFYDRMLKDAQCN